MSTSKLTIADLASLEAFASDFVRELRPGTVIALRGDLGAGKTTFVAACLRALRNDADVASPTFTFWHRYGGTPPVEHLDLYRVESPTELRDLGLDEALSPHGIAFVEWPDRVAGFVPTDAIAVTFAGAGDEPRVVTVVRP